MNKKNVSDESKEMAIKQARAYTNSGTLSVLSINSIAGTDCPDIKTIQKEVNDQIEKVLAGNSTDQETMLIAQSKTLDALFNKLVTCSVKSESFDGMRVYTDLALRAQNQCIKSVMALNTLKNPQTNTVVKQQNVALNQQVNVTHLKNKSENELLESLEDRHVKWLDKAASSTPIKTHSQLETVAFGRGKNTGRQTEK